MQTELLHLYSTPITEDAAYTSLSMNPLMDLTLGDDPKYIN